ncbi:MAG: ABC transporter substrate-binding protein [bacterium]
MRSLRAAVCVLWLTVVGCGGGGPDTENILQRLPSGVAQGGVFRFNLTESPRSLDPARVGDSASGHIAENICEGLVEFDPNLKIVPCLAESWDVSEDGTVYTFHLRHEVRFHDSPVFPGGKGREVTAEDVRYSLTRIAAPSTRSTGYWVWNGKVKGIKEFHDGLVDRVEGFQVVDENTFRFVLDKPFAPFLNLISMSYAYVVPREAVEFYGEDFFQNPVGTGPFRFVEWAPDRRVVLERNPEYWGKDEEGNPLPYLDRIIVRFIGENIPEFQEFVLGNLEYVQPIPPDMWDGIFDKDNKPRPNFEKFQIHQQQLLATNYFGFLMGKPPMGTDKRLRHAANYAIDREAIIKHILRGEGTPASGPIPSSMPGYRENVAGFTYDPDRARQLLAEAGHPNGEGLPEIILQLNSAGRRNELIAEVIQQQLQAVGFKIQLKVVDWSQHLDSVERGQVGFFRMGWIADYVDPENFLALFHSKNFSPAGPNSTRFSDPQFDQLFEKALQTLDEEKRFELYHEAEKIVMDICPWLFINYQHQTRLSQPYVRGLTMNAMDRRKLKRAWFDL